VTVLQTIGVFVLIPLALYGVISVFTLWPKIPRGPRYRPGQEWNHEPVWWTGNPDGLAQLTVGHAEAGESNASTVRTMSTARGGAHGSW
jgi:hypothetical protein